MGRVTISITIRGFSKVCEEEKFPLGIGGRAQTPGGGFPPFSGRVPKTRSCAVEFGEPLLARVLVRPKADTEAVTVRLPRKAGPMSLAAFGLSG